MKNQKFRNPQSAIQIRKAVDTILGHIGDFQPEVMITFGSGLGEAFLDSAIRNPQSAFRIHHRLSYEKIPGLTMPKVAGHPGKLLLGTWNDRRVIIFQGRLHLYEGYSWQSVTLPVRIAASMGARVCIFTNMSGAIGPRFRPGMLVVIDDHINFIGSNPLIGDSAFRNPHSAFKEAYSRRLRRLLDEAAAMQGLTLEHGVYVAVSGPNFETPAEVRALGLLGGDLVGMSTVGEVLVARRAGMECCGISGVANMAAGVSITPIGHEQTLQAAQKIQLQLTSLLDTFLGTL